MQKNSVNKVFLVGHLGADPEARYTKNGRPVASFSLATNESWKQSGGTPAEHTEWHSIVAWDKLAEFSQQYLYKINTYYYFRSWISLDHLTYLLQMNSEE